MLRTQSVFAKENYSSLHSKDAFVRRLVSAIVEEHGIAISVQAKLISCLLAKIAGTDFSLASRQGVTNALTDLAYRACKFKSRGYSKSSEIILPWAIRLELAAKRPSAYLQKYIK